MNNLSNYLRHKIQMHSIIKPYLFGYNRIQFMKYAIQCATLKSDRNSNNNKPSRRVEESRISTQTELTDRIRSNRKLFRNSRSELKKEHPNTIKRRKEPEFSLSIKTFPEKGDYSVSSHIDKNNTTRNPIKESIIKASEKEYLSRCNYKLRNESLDENAKKLLSEFKSISKTSTDPKHLTFVHEALVQKIGNILRDRVSVNSDSSNIFIELQPGFGLVTKYLSDAFTRKNQQENIQNKLNQNLMFILIESFSPYFKYLNAIKDENEKKGLKTHVIKCCPFEQSFLTKNNSIKKTLSSTISEYNNPSKSKKNIVIFGIVPWSYKGYLSKIFNDYLSNNGIFSLVDETKSKVECETTTEFFFYINEWLLAKLTASSNTDYSPFRSSLSVFLDIFGKVEVIDEEQCEFLYPYPLVSSPNKISLKYPYNKLQWKKMYLINLKLNTNESIKNKRLFYLFISNLFVRPNDILKDSQLKSVCKDVGLVCKELGLNKYENIRKIESHIFLRLFNYLVDNKDGLSNLSYLENNYANTLLQSNQTQAKHFNQVKKKTFKYADSLHTLEEIKIMNTNLSGRFVVSSNQQTKDVNIEIKQYNLLNMENDFIKSDADDEEEIFLNSKFQNKN
jgi:hypothetical protein